MLLFICEHFTEVGTYGSLDRKYQIEIIFSFKVFVFKIESWKE